MKTKNKNTKDIEEKNLGGIRRMHIIYIRCHDEDDIDINRFKLTTHSS
jgi:hypothetical protein